MANPEHVKIVRQGAEVINRWRKENSKIEFDLRDADLQRIDLSPVGMNLADLQYANLEGANLTEANLRMAKLKGARLSGALLGKASLDQTDLTDVDLTNAWLFGTVLNYTWLFGTDFTKSLLTMAIFHQCWFDSTVLKDAILGSTIFSQCDLHGIIELEEIEHRGPSTIGIDTILRSEGDIPREFLKGCGFPDHVIEYVKSLATTPIQYYTCFISHSSKDEPSPKHLFDKLQGAGVRCWYFPEHARTGEKLWEEIDRAIRHYDKLVVICSASGLSSEPVVREIERALKREKEEAIQRLEDQEKVKKGELSEEDFSKRRYQTRILFPIMIDDYLLSEWKHPLQSELKNRVVADFRGWEDFDKFQKAFDKLLADLNAKD